MWSLEPRSDVERLSAALALVAAVAGAVQLEELGDRLRREEHRAWWASNGRDVVNAAALLVISGALMLRGFPGPAALVAGGLLTLALTGVCVVEGKLPARAHPRLLALAAALLLALPLLAWPSGVAAGLGRLAAALFPG
ncbi:MAG TPA: hypothetical protein VFP50_10490 [Anaeromyxobacteraceae bacterium]|nr:hypothetical protein [Anaeromyxobacteraceae bacterium]